MALSGNGQINLMFNPSDWENNNTPSLSSSFLSSFSISKTHMKEEGKSSGKPSGKGSLPSFCYTPPPPPSADVQQYNQQDKLNAPATTKSPVPSSSSIREDNHPLPSSTPPPPLPPPYLLECARVHLKAMVKGADDRRFKVGSHLHPKQMHQQSKPTITRTAKKPKPKLLNPGDVLPDVDVMVYPSPISATPPSNTLGGLYWSTLLTSCETTRLAVIEFYVTKTRTAAPIIAIDP